MTQPPSPFPFFFTLTNIFSSLPIAKIRAAKNPYPGCIASPLPRIKAIGQALTPDRTTRVPEILSAPQGIQSETWLSPHHAGCLSLLLSSVFALSCYRRLLHPSVPPELAG